jgi:hypothetical protein
MLSNACGASSKAGGLSITTCLFSPGLNTALQALFKQLFSFMNVNLFNQLLLRRECCSFSNGEYVKTGLALVENWVQGAGEWRRRAEASCSACAGSQPSMQGFVCRMQRMVSLHTRLRLWPVAGGLSQKPTYLSQLMCQVARVAAL